MIIIRPLIDVLGKIMKLPKNSYLDPTTLGSGTPSSSNWLRGDSVWASITPGPTNYGLYAQTAASIPVVNTTVETSIINGGVGTLTVPPNGFSIGDSFYATLSGIISANNNDTIRLEITSDGNILGDSGLITLPAITNKFYNLYITFTIRSLGSAGVAAIATTGQFTYSKNASNAYEGADFFFLNNTTFDTTVINTLDVKVQWGTASVNNSIGTEIFVLNKIY
jgi:hypothetical protein